MRSAENNMKQSSGEMKKAQSSQAQQSQSQGVTGVAWKVQIMSVKCLNSAGQGSDSSVIAGIEFATTNGAKIMNASLDTTGFSQSVSNAIVAARDAGIIFDGQQIPSTVKFVIAGTGTTQKTHTYTVSATVTVQLHDNGGTATAAPRVGRRAS
jgi:hypothetical protein